MNSAQRLLRVTVAVLGVIMVLFPPYRVCANVHHATWWVRYAPLWQAPYPPREEALRSQPYCPDGRASGFLLLAQLVVLWMGSSYLYTKLGKLAWDPEKYPEYYRP